MQRLIECVPNFSEGRDRSLIDAIVGRIAAVPGVLLLHVDAGHSANRTVVTFAGEPPAVLEGAFAGVAAARELIDLRSHEGVHWRQGATDVCPLVPLAGVTMRECVTLAHGLGQRVAAELGLPVYFYGQAAATPGRVELSRVRRGGYEGLERRFREGRCLPDLGPGSFDPRSGVVAIGARGLMIAYNVNLDRDDLTLAQRTARRVRERGVLVRDSSGQVRRDAQGAKERKPGLPGCRANGWRIEEYGRAQVTTNLLDYRRTGLHQLYARVDALARQQGARAAGSELIGLAPEAALLAAARHYGAGGARVGTDAAEQRAIDGLGLDSVRPFDPESQLLERCLKAAGVDLAAT